MKRQAYLDLLEKHRKEINEFPIAYAFNEEQLKEALTKLGVESVKECVTIFNHGDIVKKENAPKFLEMLKRHMSEIKIAMKEEAFAEAAFLYEMDNHEYAINWDGDDDVLRCFGFDFNDLREMKLMGAYRRARAAHMKHAEEWDMI